MIPTANVPACPANHNRNQSLRREKKMLVKVYDFYELSLYSQEIIQCFNAVVKATVGVGAQNSSPTALH